MTAPGTGPAAPGTGPAAHGGRDPLEPLARGLGCTTGQAYTVVIGMALAVLLAVLGIPPTLRERAVPAARAPAALPPPPRDVSVDAEPQPGPVSLTPFVPFVPAAPSAPAPAPTAAPAPAPPPPPALGPGAVRVFARVVAGSPSAAAVGPDGRVYVAVNPASGPSSILRYARDGTLQGAFVVQGQPAQRTAGLTGVAFAGPKLLALDAATGRVLELDPSDGATRTVAQIPDVPACVLVVAAVACEPGPADHPPRPTAVAVTSAGRMYVTDAAQATIWRIPAGGGAPAALHQDVDYASGEGPAGVTFDDRGRLVFTVTKLYLPTSNGEGAIYALALDAAGGAGARTQIRRLPASEGPAGIAASASGRLFVALSNADAMLIVDGSKDTRVASDPSFGFSRPGGVTFDGTSVLVANRGGDAASWAVLRVGAGEEGATRP